MKVKDINMNFNNLRWFHLLLMILYQTSNGLTCTDYKDDKERQLYFCPNSENYNVSVAVRFQEDVRVKCVLNEVDLTLINDIIVGEVFEFHSENCSLLNILQRVFEQWNVTGMERWNFSGFSNRDFILNKRQFDGLSVMSIRDFRMDLSNVIGVESDTFADFENLESVSLSWNKLKTLPDLFGESKSLNVLEIIGSGLVDISGKFAAPSLRTLRLSWNNLTKIREDFFVNVTKLKVLDLTGNKITVLPEKLLYPLADLEAIYFMDNGYEKIPSNFFEMNKKLSEKKIDLEVTTMLDEGDDGNYCSSKYRDGMCQCATVAASKEFKIFCPSAFEQEFEISVKPEQEVSLSCMREQANLTALDLHIGEVKLFESRNCNMLDQFEKVFTKWDVRNTETLKLRNFADRDFILQRSLLRNLNVSTLEKLDIQESNIVAVEEDALSDFINLKRVILKSNNIRNFPDMFGRANSLELIDLGQNKIGTLSEKLTAPSLKSLLMWSNQIRRINESYFANATQLITLELMGNQIADLPSKLLHPLVNLQEINLSQNKFGALPEDFFKMNQRLVSVRLFNVNMTSISGNTFKGLRRLTTLMLHMNSLTRLPENLLADSPDLSDLYLNRNRLESLPPKIFRNLRKLKHLHLSDNRLSRWDGALSAGLNGLQSLYVNGNDLVEIESDFSYGLGSLKELDLSSNRISRIHTSAFSNLQLARLDLSRNSLTDAEEPSFVDGLRAVRTLSLGRNHFKYLPDTIEAKVKILDMSFNKMEDIAVQSLINMQEVNLRNNSISMIDFRGLDPIIRLPESRNIDVKIHVDDNPLDCGCSVYNLVQFLDGTYKIKDIYGKVTIDGNLICRTPPHLAEKPVNEIKSEEFTCDYSKIYRCPNECDCKMYPKYESFNVSCADSQLRVPPVIPHFQPARHRSDGNSGIGIFTIRRLVVNLTNNSIGKFTERDASYVNVSELYLSHNALTTVEWLPPMLEVLELNDNRLENLDYRAIGVLNASTTLKRLTLHDNSWKCNCKLLNLTRLIKSENLKISFDEKILCADGKKVIRMTEGSLCVYENQAALIAIGLCFFILLIAIGVALILYYKYEYHVKVWLYSQPLFMRFVAEEDLDKDKVYDAFLSYSHKDEDFVVRELVPVLEGGPEPYKLCIHIRDWVVGEFITRQITDSVQKSRRTIIVLSKNFLESEWATMEFMTAHTHAMNEGRHRLIVILYGDVDPSAIEDNDLRTYLSTNTYVKWTDPWFWKKLKYVLPHRRGTNGDDTDHPKRRNQRMENIMVTIDKMDLIDSAATPNVGTPPAVSLDPLLLKSSPLNFKANSNTETPPAESGLITTTMN